MGLIQLLPDDVASQVAAGEVVERPASIVKELVENSLDAGATQIELAIVRGGMSSIRVVDNGTGMDRDDALLSLERHATSKIRTGADLARIATLGFRGEALPSIASVTRFRLATRPPQALEGTEIRVHGGKLESVSSSGEAPGTLIEARSLFYNLPARRKFLRSENTETHHIQHQLHLQAIGHPEVGFVFLRDQTLVFHAPPVTRLADRLRDLRGADALRELLEVEPLTLGGVRIWGFIGRAGVSRSTRAEQVTFVNGRPVENLTIQYGLREGYHTALMKGQYAVTYLFLELDPEVVDVNVHPAKREVRFRQPDTVREAVAEAVRRALESDRVRWTQTFRGGEVKAGLAGSPELIPEREQFALRRDWAQLPAGARIAPPVGRLAQAPPPESGALQSSAQSPVAPGPGALQSRPPPEPSTLQSSGQPPTAPEPGALQPGEQTPGTTGRTRAGDFQILGVLGRLYVLMENKDGLVLVDQHAAHERILFERLRSQMEHEGVPMQRLLLPLIVQITPKDFDWIITNAVTLEKMGFLLEPFGELTLKIDAIPQFFRVDDPTDAIRSLVDELRSMTSATSRLRMGEDVIAKTVCRHAIKANDKLRTPEIEQLISDLLGCELPYCCPHGRPTMIQVTYDELEKKFGRKV
jgi:DNA mismatch repair protein MutL